MSEPQATPNTEPVQGSQPDTSQGKSEGTTQPEPTFTQSDIDRIAAKTRQEAREAAKKTLLEELGFEDVSALKSFAEEAKKRKEADMSELEKAQLQIEAANKRATDAETARQTLLQEIATNNKRQAFIKAASTSGGQNVEDLFILVQAKHGQDFESVFDDKAIADDGKMGTFIKQVQSGFPSYFGTSSAGSPSNAGGFAPTSQTELNKQTQKQLKSKFGKL